MKNLFSLSILSNAYAGIKIILCALLFLLVANSVNAQTYCTPGSWGGSVCSGSVGSLQIATVKLSGNTFYSGGVCTAYNNLTGSVTCNVTAGQSYTLTLISVAATSPYAVTYGAWMDFNGNGTFTDAGEIVMPPSSSTTVAKNTSLTMTSASFTIPPGASGTTRMRVLVYGGELSGYAAISNTPCSASSSYYGQYVDFALVITPGVACSGQPASLAVSPTAPSICSAATQNIALTLDASGYTYQWQQCATSNGTYVNVTAGTNATTATFTTPTGANLPYSTTYYACLVTCTASGLTTLSQVSTVSLASFINCYCTPNFTAAATATQIKNVTTVGMSGTNINNTTSNTSTNFNIYSSPVPGASLSTQYTIQVAVGTSTRRNNINVWIDWDQNGVFGNNANELIGGSASVAQGTYSYVFTVPGTATPGTTAMRVDYNNSTTTTGFQTETAGTIGTNSACTFAAATGETQDYSIQINAAACSGTPTAGSVYTGSSGTATSSSLCPGGTQAMYVTGQTSGVSGITFQWQSCATSNGTYTNVSGGAGATSANYTTPTLTNSSGANVTTYYKCLITCTNSSSSAIQSSPVAVTVYPTPVISIAPTSTSICHGATSGNLVASNSSTGTTTYGWSPSASLSASTGSTVTADPTATQTYTVTGTANTCTATSTIVVSVNPTAIGFSPPSPSIGIGSGIAVTASATSTNGTVSYVWNTPSDGSLSATSGATVTASPLSTETYTVTASDGSGCSITGTVTVNVKSGTAGTVACGYAFSAGNESGSWSDLSGGTTLGTTVAANYTINLSGLSPAFNFDFNGITYNTFGVNGQGWMYFGTNTPSASVTTPLSSGLNVDGVIAVMASAQLSSMSVSYIVTGTTPNRQLAVEWSCNWNGTHAPFELILNEHGGSSYSFPWGGGGTQASDGITFQYYDEADELTAGGSNIQIGLIGASDADFNNRMQSSGHVTSGSTSAGTANTSVVTVGSQSWFGGSSGTTTPQIQFLYVPQIATPTISPNTSQNVCTGSTTTLTGISTNPASPTTWLWSLAGSAAPGTNNTSTYSATPGSAGNFFYTVTVTNSTGCSRTSYAEAIVAANCCTPPTQGATALSFDHFVVNGSSSSAAIGFTRGNGTGGYIVIAKDGSAPTSVPVYNTTYSGASSVYGTTAFGDSYLIGSGTTAGDDATIVAITVTGLTSGHSYYFAVYEYASLQTCYVNSPLSGGFCIGPPATASITPNAPSTCPSVASVLSLTGLNAGGFYTYQWQNSATSGSGYGNSSGTSTSATYTTPAPLPSNPAYYVCQVTCPNTSSTTQSNQDAVSNLPFYGDCYCDAHFDYQATNTGIAGVTLDGNTTNLTYTTSTIPNGNIYTDWGYQSSPNPDIAVGTAYTVTVKVGSTNGPYAVDVWIDWDHDGIYETTNTYGISELVASEVTAVANSGTATFGPFTVPATALSGFTGMRVRAVVGTTGMNTTANVCNNYNSNTIAGETEDFVVSILSSPCSGTPTAGTASPTNGTLCPGGGTTIGLSGYSTGVSGITFQWMSSPDGSTNWTNVSGGSGATSPTYTTPSLANATGANLPYYYRCVVTCTGSTLFANSSTATVTVYPVPIITINSSNPYTETDCYGTTVYLNASNSSTGSTGYSWLPAPTLGFANNANTTTAPAVTTTYTVTATANGCTGTATAILTVNPSAVTITPAAPSIGLGSGVNVTASATSTTPGAITYSWLASDGTLSSQSGATVTAAPLALETYTVTATDQGGCSNTGTVTVNVTSGTPGKVSCGYSFSGGQACYNGTFGSCCTFPTITGSSTSIATNSGMSNANYSVNLSGLSPAFNFDFNGITYSTFGINTNGFVYLGATAPSASTIQPIASGAASDGIISAFGAALTGGGSTTLSYLVSGTSPNRTLTIEWANVKVTDYSHTFSFQIILNENGGASSNVISFLYSDQNCVNIGAGNANDNVQMGLRGAANSDFNDLTGNSGFGYGWTAGGTNNGGSVTTSAGSANTSGIAWGSGGYPFFDGINQITYTPTIATPTITPTGQQNICTGGSGVSLTGNSTLPASPTTWQWNLPGGPIGSANSSTYLSNPGSAGNYFYTVTVTNSAGCSRTSYATPVVVTVCCVAPSSPSASSNTPVCSGNLLSLTSSVGAGATPLTYSWTGPNGFTAAAQNVGINGATTAATGTYTVTISNICGSTTTTTNVSVTNCTFNYTAKLFLQGYYLGGGNMSPLLHLLGAASTTAVDTVIIQLWSNGFTMAYSDTAILQSTGTVSCTFPGGGLTGAYYIVVKHRNSIDTWSASAQSLSSNGTYDFTTGASQAFNSNMINLGSGVYGIYGGDVNHDGFINGSDKAQMQSVLSSFTIGVYNVNDITGDGFVDDEDYRLLENNIPLGIAVSHP